MHAPRVWLQTADTPQARSLKAQAAALATKGQLEAALAGYQEALRAEPGDPEGHQRVAELLEWLERTPEAARAYDDAALPPRPSPWCPGAPKPACPSRRGWGREVFVALVDALEVRAFWPAQRVVEEGATGGGRWC